MVVTSEALVISHQSDLTLSTFERCITAPKSYKPTLTAAPDDVCCCVFGFYFKVFSDIQLCLTLNHIHYLSCS